MKENIFSQYKFRPLHNVDGSPCYFRVACLALFACSLIMHVALKPLNNDNQDQNKVAQPSSYVPLANTNDASSGTISVATYNQDGKNSYIHSINNSGSFDSIAYAKEVEFDALRLNNASISSSINSNISGSLVVNEVVKASAPIVQKVNDSALAYNVNVSTSEEDNSSAWDLFDFNKKIKDKELFSNRKQALSELQDGANFFSSCGNINASYKNCKFDFSNKVSPHFDTSIQVSNSSFQITLVAKGQQKDDECVKFVAKSNGEYQAFNAVGQESQQCFLNTNLKDLVLTNN